VESGQREERQSQKTICRRLAIALYENSATQLEYVPAVKALKIDPDVVEVFGFIPMDPVRVSERPANSR
jgi:hypothetical protein